MALGASRTPGPGISTIPSHLVVVQILAIDVAQHRKHGLAYAARTAFQISGAVLPLTRSLASSNWPFLIRCISSNRCPRLIALLVAITPGRVWCNSETDKAFFSRCFGCGWRQIFARGDRPSLRSAMTPYSCASRSTWPLMSTRNRRTGTSRNGVDRRLASGTCRCEGP